MTAYNALMDTAQGADQFIAPASPLCNSAGINACYIGDGNAFYAAAERPYSISQGFNSFLGTGQPIALSNEFNKPAYYQISRTIRLGLKFTF